MGMQTSVYVFYGVLIGKHDNTDLEWNAYDLCNVLNEEYGDGPVTDDVIPFLAGDYDQDDLYLVIHRNGFPSLEVEPGQVRFFPHNDTVGNPEFWNDALGAALEKIDKPSLSRFGWFVVPDVG
jgi:hypothetical protein